MKKINKVTTTLMATTLLANSVLAPVAQIIVSAEEGTNAHESAQKVLDLQTRYEEAKKVAEERKTAYEKANLDHSNAKAQLDELNLKVSELKTKEKALTDELAKVDDEQAKAELVAQLDAVNSNITKTEGEIKALETKVNDLEKLVATTKDELAKAQADVTSKEDKLAKAVEDLKAEQAKLDAKEAEITKLNGELDNVNTNLDSTNASIENKNKEITALEAEITTLETEISDIKQNIEKVNAEKETAKAQLDDATKNLAEKEANLENVLAKSKELREAYEAKKAQTDAKETEMNGAKAEYDKSAQESAKFETQEFLDAKAKIEADIETATTAKNQAQQELEGLQSTLANLEKEALTLANEMVDLVDLVEGKKGQISAKTKEFADSKNDAAAYEAQHKAEIDALQTKKELVQNIKNQLLYETQQRNGLKADRASVQQSIKELEDELSGYGTLEEAQAHLAALEEERASGAVGFFKAYKDTNTGAEFAYNLFTVDTGKRYFEATHIGDERDATSWNNFMVALDMVDETNNCLIDEFNDLRFGEPLEGATPAKMEVSFSQMATAMYNSNAIAYQAQQDGSFDHLHLGFGNENILCSYRKNNVKEMYRSWYYEEKEEYIFQNYPELPNEGTGGGQYGHYGNLVNSTHNLTGTGVSNYSARVYTGSTMNTFATQHFSNGTGYSVSEFRSMANEYRSNLEEEIAKWENVPTRIEEINTALTNLKGQLTNLNNQISEMDQRIAEDEERLHTADDDYNAYRGQIQYVFNEIHRLTEVSNELDRQLAALIAEKDGLDSQVAEKQAQIDVNENAQNETNSSIASSKENVNNKANALTALQNTYKAEYSQEHQDEVNAKTASDKAKYEALNNQFNALNTETKQAYDLYKPYIEGEKTAKDQRDEAKATKDNAQTLFDAKNQELVTLTSQKDQSIAKLGSTRDTLTATEKEVADLTKTVSALNKQIAGFEAALNKATTEKEDLQTSVETLTANKDAIMAEVETAKANAKTVKSKLDTANNTLETVKVSVEEKETSLANLNTKKAELEKALEVYNPDGINAIKTQLNAIKLEIADLNEKVEKQEEIVKGTAEKKNQALADYEEALNTVKDLEKQLEEENNKPEPEPEVKPEEGNGNDETTTPEKDDVPQTGDSSNIGWYITVSGTAIIASALLMGKKKEEE